jgi:sporulation protein YlmC with PRC-barrel domain
MARATAHPNHRLISSEDVHGTDVIGANGEIIGKIDHLLIDKESGRVTYAVMSFGGVLGIGHNHYPIAWSDLTYDTEVAGYVTDLTEDQLRNAPEFSDDSWQSGRMSA